jgi:epoxyqueuosine reductase
MTTSTSDPSRLLDDLKRLSVEQGFGSLGVTRPASVARSGDRLREFVALDRHGDMNWLSDRIDWRADPTALWPDARSVVMLTTSYAPEHDPLQLLKRQNRGVISAYAARRDYHDVVKKRLKVLARWLVAETGCDVKVFVDTAPVMEKPLAAAAGVGWQGKHTNLVSRQDGSWTFLGAIFTTLDLPGDQPSGDHCGTCSRCLDICPTAAFPAPYQLDANRCLAYLTVEHQGMIPVEFRHAMGNRIFGCDDCLATCPWNRFAGESRDQKLTLQDELLNPPLGDLLALDDAAFRAMFAQTPVKRLGRNRFLRNVLVAAGNSGDPALLPRVRALLDDASPLVRGSAVWALSKIDPELAEAEKTGRLERESDVAVRAEWTASPT